MNEEERAARDFARDLDAFLSGKEPGAGADRPALEAARLLARADLAAESRVRETLRERLLNGRVEERRGLFPLPVGALAAVCAAVLLLLPFLPRLRMQHAPAGGDPSIVSVPPAPRAPAYPRGAQGLPTLPGRLPLKPAPKTDTPFERLPLATPFEARRPAEGASPFKSVPLEGGTPFVAVGPGSPIVRLPAGKPIATVTGREVAMDGGRAVVWDLEGGSIALLSRPVRIDEIFGRPEL